MWPFDRWFRSRAEPVAHHVNGRLELVEWPSGGVASRAWTCEQVSAQDLVRLHLWAVNGDFADCRVTLSDARDVRFIATLLCEHGGCREGRITDARVKTCKAYHPQARVFSQRGDFPGYCFVLLDPDPAAHA